jgi:hypothetical protein
VGQVLKTRQVGVDTDVRAAGFDFLELGQPEEQPGLVANE